MRTTTAIAILLATLCGACAAPLQRTLPKARSSAATQTARPARAATADGRPTVGVAFGGGSARGLAHIGVIRWFEEHRIPIDVAAGTSMGGLVGGIYATGLDADELERLMATINWDEMFGASNFAFKNIRRKTDGRSFPSRIEFGVAGGIVAPTSLNSGEQVERFLSRVTAPYYDLSSFDDLPTPFRTVAVDLVGAKEVVLDHGSLARAMRATMSLPLIFPPAEVDGRALVDGGAMNNVPADVVRGMGAGRVVAVSVGELDDKDALSYTLFSVASTTLDAMMRASTLRSLASADIVISVPLEKYGSLDWRRSAELAREGYRAAEAKRDVLLPLAVSEAEYARWRAARQERRRRSMPPLAFVNVEGFSAGDTGRVVETLESVVGRPLDAERLQRQLAPLSGLDRYQSVGWHLTKNEAGETGLVISAVAKPYAPPFLMLGLNLENTTSSEFRLSASARYLSYGLVTPRSELRLDATMGTGPALGAEFYQPLGRSPLFLAPYGSLTTSTFNLVADDEVQARYEQVFTRAGLSVGANLGARSDVRAGVFVGHLHSVLQVGDPAFPTVAGAEAGVEGVWRFDGQDSPIIPSGGAAAEMRLRRLFLRPGLDTETPKAAPEPPLTQLSGTVNRFWSLGEANRVFISAAAGTSFDGAPLPTNQFGLGAPLRLGAYRQGELLGNHFWTVSGGYFRQIGRLPDFMGGSIFAGAWLENGDAFNRWTDAAWRTNGSAAVVLDTLVGPLIVGGSAGGGRWRTYLGVGRILR